MRSMPMPQPTAGVALAAELLEQPVVAAAAADRALRAELVGDPLEDGQVVVVEAAHQARVDAVVEPGGVEQALHGRRNARATRRRGNRSSRGAPSRSPASPGSCCRGSRSGLRVQPALRVLVERIGVLLEVRDQRRRGARCARPAGRALLISRRTSCRRRARGPPSSARHITICSASTSGPAIAERLDADLVELAVAALLRPLVAEHRPAYHRRSGPL